MIPTNTTRIEIEFYKIAKKHEISMIRSSESIIEIVEEDDKKARAFIKEIKALSKDTKIVDLIQTNQHTDVRGNDIRGSKALYLVDEDYYQRLIGGKGREQISMF